MRPVGRALRLGLAAPGLLIAGMASTASAAPATVVRDVSISGFAFSPSAITINVGDSVRWTNNDAVQHSGDTPVLQPGQSATTQYSSAGPITYHCSVHFSMTGTITVVAASTPTPQPTPVPTPRPTTVPTAQPTVAPTPQPTVAPTAQPILVTPPPTPSATASPSPTPTPAPIATSAAPASRTVAPVAIASSAPGPLIVAGAAVLIVGLGGVAWLLLRR